MGGLARFLGRPAVAVDGRQIEVPVGRRGALWLYIVHQHRWVDRSELTFLLWPDSEQRRASANLRQVMVAIARSGWGLGLERDRRRARCLIDTDVRAFTAAADARRWDDALAAYTGTFLEGFALDDAPEFMDWLELERAAIHDRWRSISLAAIDRWLASGLPHEALVLAERLLARDPLDEDAARRAMEAANASGEERRALLVYEALRTGLRREIGLEPTPDTSDLARRIVEKANAGDRADIEVPEPAVHVSGTTWSELLRLKRYTLVRSVGTRLEMHALVARFGREAAEATGETERVATLLGAYFGERFERLGRGRSLHDDDLPHLAAAWHHAVASAAFDRVAAMAVGMQRAFVAVGRSDEAVRSCDEAVATLAAATGRDRDVALARVLCGASSRHGPPPDRARLALALSKAHGDLLGRAIAHASLALGQPLPEARFHHRHAKVLFHRARDPAGVIDTCLRFGRRVCLSGYYAEAAAIFDEARARSIAIAARVDEAEAIAGLADVSTLTGDLDRAETHAHEAWELFGSVGAPLRALTCVGTLLWVARIRRDVEGAKHWTAVYLARQEETGRGAGVEAALVRSHLSYLLRRYDEAWDGASAVMRLVGERSAGLVADRTRLRMARIAIREGDACSAVALVRAVLRPHLAIERPRHAVDAAVVAAEVTASHGFDAAALELLHAAVAQPAMDADARVESEELARRRGWLLGAPAAGPATALADLVARVHVILDSCS